MRTLEPVRTDILVIGGGAAGMTAASYLSEKGNDVVLIDTGTSSTVLSTGCMAGANENEEMLEYLLPRLSRYGLGFVTMGKDERMITNVGTYYGCRLAQKYTGAGSVQSLTGSHLAVVGMDGDESLDTDLVCGHLTQGSSISVRPYQLQSRTLESLDAFCEAIMRLNEKNVMIPPLFRLKYYEMAMRDLTERTGKNVFEPVTPLSIPGSRLGEALRLILKASGCRILNNRRAIRMGTMGARFDSATVIGPGTTQDIIFSTLIIAAGNAIGPGMTIEGREMKDPLESFKVSNRKMDQTMPAVDRALTTGFEVDRRSRLLMSNGNVAENAYACGSCLEHMSYPLGKGLLDVLDSAWYTVKNVEAGR